MSADNIDLNSLLNGQVTVTPEQHPDIIAAEVENIRRNNRIESYKGVVVFLLVVSGIVLSAVACIYEIRFDQSASEDTKRLAQTALSSLLAGAISFIVGRKVGSK